MVVIFDIALAALYLILTIYQMVTRSSRYNDGRVPRNVSNYEFVQWTTGLLGFLFPTIFGLVLVVGSADADFDVGMVANYIALMIFYGYNLAVTFVVLATALFNFPAHSNYQRLSFLESFTTSSAASLQSQGSAKGSAKEFAALSSIV